MLACPHWIWTMKPNSKEHFEDLIWRKIALLMFIQYFWCLKPQLTLQLSVSSISPSRHHGTVAMPTTLINQCGVALLLQYIVIIFACMWNSLIQLTCLSLFKVMFVCGTNLQEVICLSIQMKCLSGTAEGSTVKEPAVHWNFSTVMFTLTSRYTCIYWRCWLSIYSTCGIQKNSTTSTVGMFCNKVLTDEKTTCILPNRKRAGRLLRDITFHCCVNKFPVKLLTYSSHVLLTI